MKPSKTGQSRSVGLIVRRLIILALVFGQIAYHFSWANVHLDPDIWWHLATGRWIVQHHAVPATDPFSEYGQDRPWVAYMWLYDLGVFKIHENQGLTGIEYLKTGVALLFALTLFLFLQYVSGSFALAALFTVLVLVACLPLATPRPWLVTMAFFAVELAVLTKIRETGQKRLLWILPVLFVLWANLHVQFIYGLILIALFLIEGVQQRFMRSAGGSDGSWRSARLYGAVLVLCTAAACLNPYGVRLYYAVWEIAQQGNIYLLIQELSPPNFRSPTHWLFLGLVVGAAYTLGRRKTTSVLPYLLLLFGLVSSLRIQRDVWLAAVAGAAIIAGWPSVRRAEAADDQEWTPRWTVSGLVLAALAAVPFMSTASEQELQKLVSKRFPAEAVRFISSHDLPGPILNDLDWGGYLTWTLPGIPVAMDGRTNVHTSGRIIGSYRVWSGAPDWRSHPDLRKSRLVLAPRAQPLTALLRLGNEFRIAYEDDLAVVFVR